MPTSGTSACCPHASPRQSATTLYWNRIRTYAQLSPSSLISKPPRLHPPAAALPARRGATAAHLRKSMVSSMSTTTVPESLPPPHMNGDAAAPAPTAGDRGNDGIAVCSTRALCFANGVDIAQRALPCSHCVQRRATAFMPASGLAAPSHRVRARSRHLCRKLECCARAHGVFNLRCNGLPRRRSGGRKVQGLVCVCRASFAWMQT